MEYRHLRNILNQPLEYYESESLGLKIPAGGEKYFNDLSLLAESDLGVIVEHLKFCKKLKASKFSQASLEAIHGESLTTFLNIKRKLEDLGATVTTAKSMVDCKYSDVTDTTPLQDVTNKIITESEAIVWVTKKS